MSITVSRQHLRQRVGDVRIAAVRELMREHGIELLLALGSGRHSFIGANPCWWLSGVRQLGRDAAVALPLDAEPVLIVVPEWDAPRAGRRGWIEEVVGTGELAGELAGMFRARGWRSLRLGAAGAQQSSEPVRAALEEIADTPPSDVGAALTTVAAVHDEWALASIGHAVEIAEAGYRRICEVARPGMREFELAASVDAYMRSLGADDNFLLLSASQHNRGVHAPTDRELWPGDVILAEISPSVDGQFAQICRSAVLGRCDERQRAGYELLGEAFTAGLACAGPGVPVRDLASAINRLIASRGYGQYTRPPYMRTRGHAMGLGPLIPADVSESSEVVLKTGMSFVLHPNQYLPETGYFLCGDQVVITEEGARSLSTTDLRLDSIGEAVAA